MKDEQTHAHPLLDSLAASLSWNSLNTVNPWNKGKLVGQKRPLKPKESSG